MKKPTKQQIIMPVIVIVGLVFLFLLARPSLLTARSERNFRVLKEYIEGRKPKNTILEITAERCYEASRKFSSGPTYCQIDFMYTPSNPLDSIESIQMALKQAGWIEWDNGQFYSNPESSFFEAQVIRDGIRCDVTALGSTRRAMGPNKDPIKGTCSWEKKILVGNI